MPLLRPPKKKTKTFDGCWSCREKGIKCDEGKPECKNCLKNSMTCKGYDIRLSWDPKKTDNLRRSKLYNHFQYKKFHVRDLHKLIFQIDVLVEIYNYRNLLRGPFTVFESNDLLSVWKSRIADQFQLTWFKDMILLHLNNSNVIKSIFATSLYFTNKQWQRANRYKDEIFNEDIQNLDQIESLCWICSMLNILLTSDLVSGIEIDYFKITNEISTVLKKLKPSSTDYSQLNTLIQFLNSLKFMRPIMCPLTMTEYLQELGLTKKLLESWYQILSLSSSEKDLTFFQLENELWFNKRDLLLPPNHQLYHKSYTWYVSMYIYFIKKFYHEPHGIVSINYLVNEVTPHLQELNYDQDMMGLRWCLFIIANESMNQVCDDIISPHLNKLNIPILKTGPDNQSTWIKYIQSSNKLII